MSATFGQSRTAASFISAKLTSSTPLPSCSGTRGTELDVKNVTHSDQIPQPSSVGRGSGYSGLYALYARTEY